MKRILSIAIVFVLLSSMMFVAISIRPAAASTTFPEYYPIDVADAPRFEYQVDGPIELPSHHSSHVVGDKVVWAMADFYTGYYIFTYFKLRAIGAHTEVWVRCFYGNGSDRLGWPAGDPRPTPIVTDEQINYLINQFESNIYPKDTQYFGQPGFRNGTYAQSPYGNYEDDNGRDVILVSNIGDENYYDWTYPSFVIGFYSSTFGDTYFDRNIISIDCAQWETRVGPPNYDYEGTIAHEYQHLIHRDMLPGDALFMNEGCSMYAEYLCGYGIGTGYFNSYFVTPDNSLTVWGDQGDINIIADYGAVGLWGMYLNDHYGADFLSRFVKGGIPGIPGIDALLPKKTTFDDVYRDWKLANLIRSDYPGCGKYNYHNVNLNDPVYVPLRLYETVGIPVPWTTGTSFGTTKTWYWEHPHTNWVPPEEPHNPRYDTGISMIATYGTDYIALEDWNKPGFIYFDGDDKATLPLPYLWTLTADGWYSGTGVNSADEFIAGDASVDPANPTMTIVTKWGLESYWDFGFVQVSTDGGATWTSLANAYTTFDHDPSARPTIVANLPGFTDYNPDWPSWTTMTFDLSAYAGKTVKIGFHYMTDDLTTYEGWWINSATVSGAALSLAPFVFFPKVNFQVTAVTALVFGGKTLYVPFDMWLTKDTNKGMTAGFAKKPTYIVLVVTPIMPQGLADYKFQVTTKPMRDFC
jgi:immune inhibitor A